MSLFQPSRLICSAGLLFLRGKVAKTPPGTPRTPLFSNRTPAEKYCAATETPQGPWLLVIGQVENELRLSALGMWDCAVFSFGNLSAFLRSGQLSTEN